MTKKILIKKFNSNTQEYVTLTYHCKEFLIDKGFISFWDERASMRLMFPAESVIEIQEVVQ